MLSVDSFIPKITPSCAPFASTSNRLYSTAAECEIQREPADLIKQPAVARPNFTKFFKKIIIIF